LEASFFPLLARFLRQAKAAAKAALVVAIVNVDGEDIGFKDGELRAFEFAAMMFLNKKAVHFHSPLH